MTTIQMMLDVGESMLLKIRALHALRFHASRFQRPHDSEIRQVDDFTADLLKVKQLDGDTRKAVDALEAAQGNRLKLVNVLFEN